MFLQLFLSIIFSGSISVTGPSHIDSKLRPISINDKGEILCRTRFTKNALGAHRAMKIIYGYCLITQDSIIEYTSQEIDPDEFLSDETFADRVDFQDSIFFDSNDEMEKLSEIGSQIKDLYQFVSYNASSYKVQKTLKIADFEENKQINLKEISQWSLHGAKSMDYFDNKMIHVLYDFGKVVILENVNNELEGIQIGANFDYFNPRTNEAGETENIGFDISEITGILKL